MYFRNLSNNLVFKVINVYVYLVSSWNFCLSDIVCIILLVDEGLFFLLFIVLWCFLLWYINFDYLVNCVCRNGDVIVSKWWRLWVVIFSICISIVIGDEDCVVMRWFSFLGRSRRRLIIRVYTGRRGFRDIEYRRFVM